MGAERMWAAVLASLCIVAAANADWISELGSYGGVSLDLGIESVAEQWEQSCEGELGECGVHGRDLRQARFYLSYGALAANRVPCPPRTGRSYYTPNCYKSTGNANPYHRACTVITRCYRDTS